jgi:CubicO group peptidase (beta-lactamase class C family)
MVSDTTGRRGVMAAAIAGIGLGLGAAAAQAADPSPPDAADPEARIGALAPALEAYVKSGMEAFDVPGTAVGIVHKDKLVYAKAFGLRSRKTKAPVDIGTVFQIGSTTKAFLAATLAIMVDRGHFAWDSRIVDLYPEF